MSIFDLFKKAKPEPAPVDKTDRLWELWEKGKSSSPYTELMNYESEVNNGGHSQYFFNTANCGDLAAEVGVLLTLLPEPLRGNLAEGYEAFAAQADIAGDENDDLFDQCDGVFYENERLILDILEACPDTL